MDTYKGQLLVAHPNIAEGVFARSVIFVYQDNGNGTLGLILNKPIKWTVQGLLADKGIPYEGPEYIYKGGPVNESAIIMLHEDNWYSSNTVQVSTGLAITSDIAMMQKLSLDNKPVNWRLFAGVAAWAPGQLEVEMKSRNGWLTCEATEDTVFNKDGERQWNTAVQSCASQTIDNYF